MTEKKRKGYWWECTKCDNSITFAQATTRDKIEKSKSVASFIWDNLKLKDWDQSLLSIPCKQCKSGSLKITYDFPGNSINKIQVNYIYGIQKGDSEYIPMIWQTSLNKSGDEIRYDFKYQIKRNNFGLNKPPIMEADTLKKLIIGMESLSKENIIT